ncbi:MAG: glycoside hydrolase family 5 protein [Candidatus Hadarchaeota archaeon]
MGIKINEKRLCGFNFGLWLSQSSLKKSHLKSFYKKRDVERLQKWGFNFVRLPVDYMLFEEDRNPGDYDEKKLSYIDRAISWCSEYGVHVNLDMHELPGYGITRVAEDETYEPKLWNDEDLLRRSEDIWRMFAERYRDVENLSFNLINEPIAPKEKYKEFLERMISSIRKIDEDRTIYIDGLNLGKEPIYGVDHDNIVQSFHMYEPMWVTHYGAEWTIGPYLYEAGCHIYNEPAKYPGTPPKMKKYLERIPKEDELSIAEPGNQVGATIRSVKKFFSKYAGTKADKDWLEDLIKPWLEFRKETGTPIHCGEFGVYSKRIDKESRLNWYSDLLKIFKEHEIGWSNWNFRGSFGIINNGRKEFSSERLEDGDWLDGELLEVLRKGSQ